MQKRIRQSNFDKGVFLGFSDKSETNDSLMKLESEIKDINKILKIDQPNSKISKSSKKTDSKKETPVV